MLRFIGLAAFAALAGCYTLQPAGGVAPEPGSLVAFDLNDQGRYALGGTIGPEIAQIEGLLIGKEDNQLLMSVRSVRFLRGGEQRWSGERVRVSTDHVSTTYQRRFSSGRSIALGVASIGGFAAFVISRELLGLGRRGSEGGEPPKPPPTLLRP